MSLRTKFAILLGMLGAAVLISLITAWWSFETVQQEVREPVRSMTLVLDGLGRCKRELESAGQALNAGEQGSSIGVRLNTSSTDTPTTPAQRDAFVARVAAAAHILTELDFEVSAFTRTGRTSLPNLHARIDDALLRGKDPSASRSGSLSLLFASHELIERMESRIVEDAKSIPEYSGALRQRLLTVLTAALVSTLLAIGLGFVLIRRWILRPVKALRTAAARFAQGDLDYRIPAVPIGPEANELVQLSAEFNHMAGTITELQKGRVERERLAAVGEVFQRIAHNLRSPLSGIRGLAEISRSELSSPSPDTGDLKDLQTRIISTIDRFNGWLTDFVSVTRPTSVQKFDAPVETWLRGLVETHRASAETKGVSLRLDDQNSPKVAQFDSRYLEHALSALLANAIEAAASTPPKEVVVRSTRAGSEAGQLWQLSVIDSGTGIGPDLRERIFVPYFTTKPDGNGIGLAMAMQVVKAHGGKLEVLPSATRDQHHSIDPLGAHFLMTLPLEESNVARNGQSGVSSGQDSHR